MASTDVRSIVLSVLSIVLILGAVYLVDPTIFGLLRRREGFADATLGKDANYKMPAPMDLNGLAQKVAEMTNPHSAGGEKHPREEEHERERENKMEARGQGKKEAKGKGRKDASGNEGFANLQDATGPAAFDSAEGPAGCYPRDQLTPSELLPKDPNSVWAQQNPMGTGSLKGKNFLSAGALIGVNTVGQSLRNANYQLRSEPPNPQVPVSVFYNSTIEPDTNRRDLEIN